VPYERNTLELNKLLKYREKLNLTQEELAEKAGVSTRTIQRIEKGIEPKGHTLKVLAKSLGITENDLKENITISETETINYQLAKHINLSSVFGVILPPINILLPWFITKHKNQVNELTKQIISIQIFYTIIALVCILLSPLLSKWLGITRQLTLILLIVSVIINLFIIIRNTIELDKKQKLYIKLNFSFL
jgi:transcriptional regulator with XRE-family HTH domain